MTETALYLIPVGLSDAELDMVLPAANRQVVREIKHFIVENVRSARRFLKKCDKAIDIDDLTVQFASTIGEIEVNGVAAEYKF